MLRSYILIYPRSDYCKELVLDTKVELERVFFRKGSWFDELIFALVDEDFRENC
jgi:hypothetical protein